jgi:hypothetical protein
MKVIDQYKKLLNVTDSRILEIIFKNDPDDYHESFILSEDQNSVFCHFGFKMYGCATFYAELIVEYPVNGTEPISARLYLHKGK